MATTSKEGRTSPSEVVLDTTLMTKMSIQDVEDSKELEKEKLR